MVSSSRTAILEGMGAVPGLAGHPHAAHAGPDAQVEQGCFFFGWTLLRLDDGKAHGNSSEGVPADPGWIFGRDLQREDLKAGRDRRIVRIAFKRKAVTAQILAGQLRLEKVQPEGAFGAGNLAIFTSK